MPPTIASIALLSSVKSKTALFEVSLVGLENPQGQRNVKPILLEVNAEGIRLLTRNKEPLEFFTFEKRLLQFRLASRRPNKPGPEEGLDTQVATEKGNRDLYFQCKSKEDAEKIFNLLSANAGEKKKEKQGGNPATPPPHPGPTVAPPKVEPPAPAPQSAAAPPVPSDAAGTTPQKKADSSPFPKSFPAAAVNQETGRSLPVVIEIHEDQLKLKNQAGTKTLDTYNYTKDLKKAQLGKLDSSFMLRVAGPAGNRDLTLTAANPQEILENIWQATGWEAKGKGFQGAAKAALLSNAAKAAVKTPPALTPDPPKESAARGGDDAELRDLREALRKAKAEKGEAEDRAERAAKAQARAEERAAAADAAAADAAETTASGAAKAAQARQAAALEAAEKRARAAEARAEEAEKQGAKSEELKNQVQEMELLMLATQAKVSEAQRRARLAEERAAEAEARLAGLVKKSGDLTEEADDLRRKLNAARSAEVEATDAVRDEYRRKLDDVHGEVEELRAQLRAAKGAQADTSGRKSSELERELKKSQLFASRLRDALQDRDNRMIELGDKLSNVKKDAKQLRIQAREGEKSPSRSPRKDLAITPARANGNHTAVVKSGGKLSKQSRTAQETALRLEREREEAVFINNHLTTKLVDMDETLQRLRGSLEASRSTRSNSAKRSR